MVLPQVVIFWQVLLVVSVLPLRGEMRRRAADCCLCSPLEVCKAHLFIQGFVKYVLSFPIFWYLLF